MHDSSSLEPTNSPEETRESQPSTHLIVEAAGAFNYAAWQSSVPVLRSVIVKSELDSELSSLTVELSTTPAFARPKRWTIDRLGPHDTLTIRNVDLEIDSAYLDRLDEAERGVLNFKLLHKDSCLHELSLPIRILARDEWGGIAEMGNILPAFVTPNDPLLAPLLRSTATILGENGKPTALDGYQSGDPNRAYLLTAAIWSAVAKRSLVYANPPASFERAGQKTRRVGTVLGDGLGTCLDLTLLFASAIEAIGLNPVLVMLQGHCFVGAWMIDKRFKRLIEPDCSEVRKAIIASELIIFETTLVTSHPPARFQDAVTTANEAISEEKEHEFVAVIDVSRARMSQIRPLASHAVRDQDSQTTPETVSLPLPASPGFVRPSLLQEADDKPTSPVGRVQRWQRKLLDLTLRNRLLNFRPSKQSIPIVCPDVSQLEDRLAGDRQLKLVSLSDVNPLGQRDARLHQARTQKDIDKEFARQAFDRNEVACPIEARDLESRLTALYRKVRNDLSEGGSNTLFLAIGFLRWKQNATDATSYKAPLLLVPVSLTRRSTSSPFYLTSHEDDVRFNATLTQLLKKVSECDLSDLESNLPLDDRGVDVPQVLERMRQAVRDIPGCEVIQEAAIATFSFAKYLMWKDLVDRVDQLENNRVVRHLIQDPDKAYVVDGVGPMPQPHQLDYRYSPQQIVHPLPADSSQLAAVMAASEGHDLVIVGPPGTGKSQTIANLITQCLSVGKTVLFVAEKTAALEVVHRRLRQHGLDDCCVELHSNKAERRRFLSQLQTSWDRRGAQPQTEWNSICQQLQVRRDQLNLYSAAVHTVHPNGWTAYRAMGECVRGRYESTPKLLWPTSQVHDRASYQDLEDTIARLVATFKALPADASISRVESTEWSMGWQTSLLECCEHIQSSAESLSALLRKLSDSLGLSSLTDIRAQQLGALYRFAQSLMAAELPPGELLTYQDQVSLKDIVTQHQELQRQQAQAEETLNEMLSAMWSILGLGDQRTLTDSQKRKLYRISNALRGSPLPCAEIVFHPRAADIKRAVEERPKLLDARNRAQDALQARLFSLSLLDRVTVDELFQQWQVANKSIWPLSAWRKAIVSKKLKSFMTSQGVPDPEVDLELLREHKQALTQVRENLATLSLSSALELQIGADLPGFIKQLQSAEQFREILLASGANLDSLRTRIGDNFDALVAAAHRLLPPNREVERTRRQLVENLNRLRSGPEVTAAIQNNGIVVLKHLDVAIQIRQLIQALGIPGEASSSVLERLVQWPSISRREVAQEIVQAAREFQEAWKSYVRLASATPVSNESTTILADAKTQARSVLSRPTMLRHWTAWVAIRKRAEALGLQGFVEAVERRQIQSTEVLELFRVAYARWWLPATVDRSEPLRTFQRFLHEENIEEFCRLDDLARQAAPHFARQAILHGLPPSDQVPRRSELGLLRHQMTLKRPSKSIREIIAGMPDSFRKLAPCLMMSPLSIAQFLPTSQQQFDVVVFDEASQIATWDAIGAIARGKQTIIVGDPKQLPPTNFFGKSESDEDATELEDHEKDLESILDEAQASGLPTLQLNWHYRSKHESLIAFSNWNYYGNRLVTFPAAESADRGVSFRHIGEGIYDRGKSRTNRLEAESVVHELVSRMKRALGKSAEQRPTFGVVTFNSQQQALIQDLLDDAIRKDVELEWFFSEDRIEPTMVKNLENVQGDQRDVMLFSITFGYDAAGKFPVDFGAINRDGGERRLNVAITRSCQELIVFASFLPDQLRAERSGARGVHDLKAFLEYSIAGPKAIAARIEGSLGDLESPLEESVAAELHQRGWQTESQIGVSGFRIDLGILHPDKPGSYLAGIECDGATYHRSAVARDRDKIRQQVLEGLGWNIVRVWSTDWWYDPKAGIEQLDHKLRQILDDTRQQSTSSQAAEVVSEQLEAVSAGREVAEVSPPEIVSLMEPVRKSDRMGETSEPSTAGTIEGTPLFAKQTPSRQRAIYARIDLGDVAANQSCFFDEGYSDTLRQMCLAIIASQGPILDEALVKEIARAHGFARTGARIKQRVLDLIPDVTYSMDSAGKFFWSTPSVLASIPFRYASSETDRRSLDEIALPELIGLAKENQELLSADDPAIALAREIGLARLSGPARTRLEEAIAAATE